MIVLIFHFQRSGFSYNGYINWRADIATVLIVGHFEYRPHITPACVEFYEFHSQKYPRPGARAVVAGWGFTKVSFLIWNLKELLLSFVLGPHLE